MNKRISLGVVAGLILVGVFFYFTVFRGISELSAKPAEPDRAKRGDVIEYRVIYAKEIYEIKPYTRLAAGKRQLKFYIDCLNLSKRL